ncbi:MAG: AbrB/MazE/SpoVT family DNA-binding domain-containing protein [Candidatus Hodarchaeales archaeon]|jgi:AbrB family looped-hinge helix DNA binding protein
MIKNTAKGKVGSKGELYPPKEIREIAGFQPGDSIIFIALENEITVIKAQPILDGFERKPFAKISVEEFESLTSEILD